MTPLSGCWRIEVAWRRACRSPLRASVISFSISGLTALALASVVLIRSWSMTSMQRLASSALRCEASRGAQPGARAAAVVERGHAAGAGAQLLDAVLVGEDRQ